MPADGGHPDDMDSRVHCPHCGYNLRGLPDGACPECGTPFERAKLVGMQLPTVSMGAILVFAAAWPVIYLMVFVPVSLLVVLTAGFLFEQVMGLGGFAWVFTALFYAVLTVLVCWPVCKDMARQTVRYKRLFDEDAEHVSMRRHFVGYLLVEVGAILVLSVGLSFVLDAW